MCKRCLFWFWIVSFTSIRAEIPENIEAESDIGNLFLIQSQNDGVWNAFHSAEGRYFSGNDDEYISSCVQFKSECHNRIHHLTIQKTTQTTFPFALIGQRFFGDLRSLRMPGLGVSELNGNEIVMPRYRGKSSLTVLDLSHNAIKYIPAYTFSNLTIIIEIDLSFNEISSLHRDAFRRDTPDSPYYSQYTTGSYSQGHRFHLQNLKTIRLNNNNLTIIEAKWFSDIPNLETLLLNDNAITNVNLCATFGKNYALRTLHLQNNAFSAIETLDQCLSELDSFDISNNPGNIETSNLVQINAKTINISNINTQVCYVPSNAVILRAAHNRICSVVVAEPVNTNLTELYLNHNNIHSADFLILLQSVEIIDLSHNALTQLNSNVLESLQNLTTLNISFNKFATIDFAFIEPATSLAHLDISHNILSGHFNLNVQAKALATLNIANNNLTSVQQNLKKWAPNLFIIDLNGNYFDCDELTSAILFMHFDHITPIVRFDDSIGFEDNVKGIKCHQTAANSGDGETTTQKVPKGINYNVMKNEISDSFDEKLLKLESRLIEIIANVTASLRP